MGKRESMSFSERVIWGSRRQADRKRALPGDCLDNKFGFPHLVLYLSSSKTPAYSILKKVLIS